MKIKVDPQETITRTKDAMKPTFDESSKLDFTTNKGRNETQLKRKK